MAIDIVKKSDIAWLVQRTTPYRKLGSMTSSVSNCSTAAVSSTGDLDQAQIFKISTQRELGPEILYLLVKRIVSVLKMLTES